MILVSALLVSLPGAAALAPGDHDPECKAGPHLSNHVFPAEWKILMDTHDYVNLYEPFALPHPVWTHNDVDGDLQGWEQIAGGSCGWFLYTRTYSALPQNNWLFLQFISYLDAKEVFFNVTFTFSECSAASPYLVASPLWLCMAINVIQLPLTLIESTQTTTSLCLALFLKQPFGVN